MHMVEQKNMQTCWLDEKNCWIFFLLFSDSNMPQVLQSGFGADYTSLCVNLNQNKVLYCSNHTEEFQFSWIHFHYGFHDGTSYQYGYRGSVSALISCLYSFIETKFNRLNTTSTGFNNFTNRLWAYTVQSKYMHKRHAFEKAIFQTKLELKHENKQSDTARSQSPLTALAKDFSSIKGKANLHS